MEQGKHIKYHSFSSEEGKRLEDRMKLFEENVTIIHKGVLDVEYTEGNADIITISGDIDRLTPTINPDLDLNVTDYEPRKGIMVAKVGDYLFRINPKPTE